jgi:hypothetical protein
MKFRIDHCAGLFLERSLFGYDLDPEKLIMFQNSMLRQHNTLAMECRLITIADDSTVRERVEAHITWTKSAAALAKQRVFRPSINKMDGVKLVTYDTRGVVTVTTSSYERVRALTAVMNTCRRGKDVAQSLIEYDDVFGCVPHVRVVGRGTIAPRVSGDWTWCLQSFKPMLHETTLVIDVIDIIVKFVGQVDDLGVGYAHTTPAAD